jgi:hypothetical protein
MHITKRVKAVAGVSALLGVVVAGGAAFTTSYLTAGSGTPAAAATQYIGGTITQNVAGLVINEINYGYTDDTDADIDAVQLVFSNGDGLGASVSVTLDNAGSPAVMDCDVVGSDTVASTTLGADTAGVLVGQQVVSPAQNNANFSPAYNSTVPASVAYCTAGDATTDASASPTSLVSVAGVTGISITIGDIT